jgi:hypothetical protein
MPRWLPFPSSILLPSPVRLNRLSLPAHQMSVVNNIPNASIFSVPPCIASSISAISRICKHVPVLVLCCVGREGSTDKVCRFCVFLGGFFQAPLRGSDTTVAFVHKGKNVVFVFRLEFGEDGVSGAGFAGSEKLRLQAFRMRLWARPEVHFLRQRIA